MSYRTIIVDGKQHQYTVGQTHVKVRGVGCWPKQEVGKKRTIRQYCECCGEPLASLFSNHVDPEVLCVTPKDVALVIQAQT